jgi:hypothetical protein
MSCELVPIELRMQALDPNFALEKTEFCKLCGGFQLLVYVHIKKIGSFENCVGNAAHEACGLKLEKSSLPAMRKSTVRMVVKRE